MQEIVDSVKRVTDIISEIAAASQEQTAGIEQINQAITQMDEVTQQNAALVEEAAAAADSLRDQAGNLAQVVSVFKLDGMQAHADVPVAMARAVPRAKAPVMRLATRASNAAIAPRARKIANAQSGISDEWEQY